MLQTPEQPLKKKKKKQLKRKYKGHAKEGEKTKPYKTPDENLKRQGRPVALPLST